jgi:hypothetical protein
MKGEETIPFSHWRGNPATEVRSSAPCDAIDPTTSSQTTLAPFETPTITYAA